jgi:hypothetical protein
MDRMVWEHSNAVMFGKPLCVGASIHAGLDHFGQIVRTANFATKRKTEPHKRRSNVEPLHTRVNAAEHAVRDRACELRSLSFTADEDHAGTNIHRWTVGDVHSGEIH